MTSSKAPSSNAPSSNAPSSNAPPDKSKKPASCNTTGTLPKNKPLNSELVCQKCEKLKPREAYNRDKIKKLDFLYRKHVKLHGEATAEYAITCGDCARQEHDDQKRQKRQCSKCGVTRSLYQSFPLAARKTLSDKAVTCNKCLKTQEIFVESSDDDSELDVSLLQLEDSDSDGDPGVARAPLAESTPPSHGVSSPSNFGTPESRSPSERQSKALDEVDLTRRLEGLELNAPSSESKQDTTVVETQDRNKRPVTRVPVFDKASGASSIDKSSAASRWAKLSSSSAETSAILSTTASKWAQPPQKVNQFPGNPVEYAVNNPFTPPPSPEQKRKSLVGLSGPRRGGNRPSITVTRTDVPSFHPWPSTTTGLATSPATYNSVPHPFLGHQSLALQLQRMSRQHPMTETDLQSDLLAAHQTSDDPQERDRLLCLLEMIQRSKARNSSSGSISADIAEVDTIKSSVDTGIRHDLNPTTPEPSSLDSKWATRSSEALAPSSSSGPAKKPIKKDWKTMINELIDGHIGVHDGPAPSFGQKQRKALSQKDQSQTQDLSVGALLPADQTQNLSVGAQKVAAVPPAPVLYSDFDCPPSSHPPRLTGTNKMASGDSGWGARAGASASGAGSQMDRTKYSDDFPPPRPPRAHALPPPPASGSNPFDNPPPTKPPKLTGTNAGVTSGSGWGARAAKPL